MPVHQSTLEQQKAIRFFTPHEVAAHHTRGDTWLSWLGNVYNMSPFIEEHFGDPKLLPIIQNAGKDISQWFDPVSGNLRMCTDSRTGLCVPVCPQGVPIHVLFVTEPTTNMASQPSIPWWLDTKKYFIGRLSLKTRRVRIVNTLLESGTVILEVCSEEPIKAIESRYLEHNAHAKGYVWKYLNRVLDMAGTLEENGINDESSEIERLGMNELEWLPALLLYFADDLTVA